MMDGYRVTKILSATPTDTPIPCDRKEPSGLPSSAPISLGSAYPIRRGATLWRTCPIALEAAKLGMSMLNAPGLTIKFLMAICTNKHNPIFPLRAIASSNLFGGKSVCWALANSILVTRHAPFSGTRTATTPPRLFDPRGIEPKVLAANLASQFNKMLPAFNATNTSILAFSTTVLAVVTSIVNKDFFTKLALDFYLLVHTTIIPQVLGIGKYCKMAKENGRRWLGFDISPEYVELARRRVEDGRIPLFTLQPNGEINA